MRLFGVLVFILLGYFAFSNAVISSKNHAMMATHQAERSFKIVGNDFVKDGKPFVVISGSMHYFRVMADQWKDRLTKMKAGGLNTVCTYVPWNLHNPKPSKFNFEGNLDIARFIDEAQAAGLNVIVRSSPFICAEFEFGGLPSWPLADPTIQLRCNDKKFLGHFDKFLDVLAPKLKTRQYNNNQGPIIAMQIENEYGSYGNDHVYLKHLLDGFTNRGITNTLFFASNGAAPLLLEGGSLPTVLSTINFSVMNDIAEQVKILRDFQPKGPIFVTELWDGWFDHWGETHHTFSSDDVTKSVNTLLSQNMSVNLYMYHGGTNFGFTNGANTKGDSDVYQPTVTSYDYDAPLNESGDPTPKFYAVRDVINKYFPSDTPVKDVTVSQRAAYGTISLNEYSPLLFNEASMEALVVTRVNSPTPLPMERVGQDYGFILYSTNLRGPIQQLPLQIQGIRDRAKIYLNENYLKTLDRNSDPTTTITIDVPKEGAKLDIFVENMGRINFGQHLYDPKGIVGHVIVGEQFQFNWTMHAMPLEDLSKLKFQNGNTKKDVPTFYRGTFQVSGVPSDTFVTFPGWVKGVCWVNNFNLGRYWSVGPQLSLFVPAPILKSGTNELIVFELDSAPSKPLVVSQSYANLG